MLKNLLEITEYHTVNLLPKWCEFDCDGDKINDFINNVEKWYALKHTEKTKLVWCWKYDPDFEYENAGIVGIVFNQSWQARKFMRTFSVCLDETT
jgi:hypothetical protein